jgi:hypothetical protein
LPRPVLGVLLDPGVEVADDGAKVHDRLAVEREE